MMNYEWGIHIEKAVESLNTIYTDRGIAKITKEDILKSMTLSGDVLFDIQKTEQNE